MRVERPADWETHGYLQLNPKLSILNRFRTPPPAASPLTALRAAEEDIAMSPNLAIQLLYLLRICRTFIETRLIHTVENIATLRRSNLWQATHYSVWP